MSLTTNGQANVRIDGDDANAGWFDTSWGDVAGGPNDRAYSNSPIIVDGSTITATVHSTTTQINIVGVSVANLKGNVFRTNQNGYLPISAVDVPNNRITVNRSAGTNGAALTGRIGGAYASPGMFGATHVGQSIGWVQSGDYTCSSSNNVSGGRVTISQSGDTLRPTRLAGYTSTYGDGGTARLLAGASSITLLSASGNNIQVAGLRFDGNGNASVTGVSSTGSSHQLVRCDANACATGFDSPDFNAHRVFVECVATSCTTGFALNGRSIAYAGRATSCTTGFTLTSGVAVGCIARAGSEGFRFNGTSVATAIGCVASGTSSSGYIASLGAMGAIIDCIASETGATAFSGTDGRVFIVRRCFGYRASGTIIASFFGGPPNLVDVTTLTADPFVDAPNGNFELNNTAGGGALLRALNFTLPGITTRRWPFANMLEPGAATNTSEQGEVLI